MADYPICTHARAGIVTSHPPRLGLFQEAVHGSHASTNVCSDPSCIEDAAAWVQRTSGKPAHHVPDKPRHSDG